MIGKDSHHETQCWCCRTSYLLPRALYVAARASDKISFYCPYGHEGHFAQGETVEDKLRRERDKLVQKVAMMDDELLNQSRAIMKMRQEAEAQKKEKNRFNRRVYNGVCPCCTRHFKNLGNHMRFKHPDFTAEAA